MKPRVVNSVPAPYHLFVGEWGDSAPCVECMLHKEDHRYVMESRIIDRRPRPKRKPKRRPNANSTDLAKRDSSGASSFSSAGVAKRPIPGGSLVRPRADSDTVPDQSPDSRADESPDPRPNGDAQTNVRTDVRTYPRADFDSPSNVPAGTYVSAHIHSRRYDRNGNPSDPATYSCSWTLNYPGGTTSVHGHSSRPFSGGLDIYERLGIPR